MDKERFGQFLAESRKELGLTQRELAKTVHVTDKAVSKWERGLSYPDVTLLEPLAEELRMGVEELVLCQRKPCDQEDLAVQGLLQISEDSIRTHRRAARRNFVWLSIFLTLLLVLLAGYILRGYAVEQREDSIVLKEEVNGETFLYVEEGGHLLRLRCADDIDTESIVPGDDVYRLDCRWNRRTYQGTVRQCEATGGMILGTPMSAEYEVVCTEVFGIPEVHIEIEDCYPNRYSKGYLYSYNLWQDGTSVGREWNQTILRVQKCEALTASDIDGDGDREVVVRTGWPEKPYVVYDLLHGEIVASWPQSVPEDVKHQLVCIWDDFI